MRTVLLGVTLASLAFISRVQAQPEPTQDPLLESGTNVALAESLFEAGRQLMDEKKYVEACPKFEESQRLDPSAGTLLNLGRCFELLGRTASAWTMYKRAIALGTTTNKPRHVSAAEQYLVELEPRLAHLTVSLEAPGSQVVVRVDGVEVKAASYGTPMMLDPGPHEVSAAAEAHEDWSAKVVLRSGETEAVVVPRLKGGEVVTDTGLGPLLIGGVISGSAGVACLAVGAALGIMVLGEADSAREDPSLCPNMKCTPAGVEHIESAKLKARVSTAMLVVGGTATAVGAALIGVGVLLRGGAASSAPASSAMIVPWIGDTFGASFVGRW